MGSWDCYCAICGASLQGGRIGSRTEKARAARRKRLERKRRALRTGEDEESDASEENVDYVEDVEGVGDAEGDNHIDSYDEEHSYDPELVSEESLEWLESSHCLGFNPDATGISKAFVSGPGHYSDYGSIEVENQGDPNQPEGDSSFTCYYTFDSDETAVFPFHWCCYEILARALTGSPDVTKINKDVLYNVMAELSPDYGSTLNLSYGQISGGEQFWDSLPGEEFCVTHPTIMPGFVEFLRNAIAHDNFKVPSASLNLQQSVIQDPFGKLPYDLLYDIFSYLPGSSILSLIKASFPVHNATRDKSFWKQLIRRDMPWFWEAKELLKEERPADFDDKGFYLWLDKMTTPEFGKEGPFMGIANRRRIWDVCQDLAYRYFKSLPQEQNNGTQDKYAKAILDHSASLQMPIILHPQPKEGIKTVSTQWIHSWEEVDHRTGVFESFWNAEGALVGMGVAFGSDRRTFGLAQSDELGEKHVTRETIAIPANDWITGIILHIPEMDLLEKASTTAVKGITVIFQSSGQSTLRDVSKTSSQRPLLVSGEKYLVGIIGQIGGDDLISRLGILECPRPPRDDFTLYDNDPAYARQSRPEVPFAQRQLWHSEASKLPARAATYWSSAPIWTHPNIHVVPLPPAGYHQDDVSAEMIPYQVLLWAKDAAELRQIRRISAYVVVGGTVSGNFNGSTWESRPVHDVLGLMVEYVNDYAEPKRIGLLKEKYEKGELAELAEEHMQHFDIDGPGGEYVTEVEVATMSDPKAMKLRTNRGREAYFGELERQIWDVQRAPEGEVMVGLAVKFGFKSKYNHETKEYSLLKFSSITALTMHES